MNFLCFIALYKGIEMIEIIKRARKVKKTAQKRVLEKVGIVSGFEKKKATSGKKGDKKCQKQ